MSIKNLCWKYNIKIEVVEDWAKDLNISFEEAFYMIAEQMGLNLSLDRNIEKMEMKPPNEDIIYMGKEPSHPCKSFFTIGMV